VAFPTSRDLRRLAECADDPHVSIFLRLERGHDQDKQNGLRWAHALDGAREAVDTLCGDAGALPERLREVSLDLRGMPSAVATLAALASPTSLDVFELPLVHDDEVTVGSTFRLRPLAQAVRENRGYEVLAVAINHVALFAGDGTGLRPMAMPGLPASMVDALGAELDDSSLQFHTGSTGRQSGIFHGHGGADAERTVDLERFHRELARALKSRSGLEHGPLVLVADDRHQSGLRAALGNYPRLLPAGVPVSPDKVSSAELHARVWPLVEQAMTDEVAVLHDAFERARNLDKAATGLDAVALAATESRVRRLYVDRDERVAGRIDESLGRVVEGGPDDVLDGLVALTLRRGGDAIVLERGAIPTGDVVAAELR
jgi:hypothetical protein